MTAQNILETIPEGYVKNAAGHLVPLANVREQDKMRDEVVCRLVSQGAVLSQALADFKKLALADVADTVKIAAQKYGLDLGGNKGNVTMTSFDGRYRLRRQVAELIQFTEEIEDSQWKLAMEAIRDSIQTNGTTTYIRLYERVGETDQYKAIPLDLASV